MPPRAETVCIPYALVPGLDVNSRAYKRAVQITTSVGELSLIPTVSLSEEDRKSTPPHFISLANGFSILEGAVLRDLDNIPCRNTELFYHYANKCDNVVIQNSLLTVSAQLVGASHGLVSQARTYRYLVRQQDTLLAVLSKGKSGALASIAPA